MKLARRRSVGRLRSRPRPPRSATAAAAVPRLKVSENRRFLVYEDGRPFFYLGDTAWELFHRLNREEADRYLEDRARKGFTVIQAVALAELDGLDDPNPYGHRPLRNNDPTRPDVKEGPANDYWDHVDYIVEKANSLGLYIGFLPTWGDKWNKKWGTGPEIFTAENAAVYGEWLGRRYRDRGIIWILGGDRPVETEAQQGDHPRDGPRPAQGRRRDPPDDVPPDGRQRLLRVVPRRGLARLQHAAERPRRRVHRALRRDARRLRPHAGQAGDRRRADLRGPPGLVQGHEARPLDRRRRAAAALLGPLLGRLRPHLRPPLGLADVGAGTQRRSTTRSCRGSRPSTSPAPARCSTAGGCSSRGPS